VTDPRPALPRRLLAEAVGTALLVTVVVGSGIAARRLSPDDTGLQLLQNSLATALALPVIILMAGPVSGGHLNPAVTFADWLLGRRSGTGLPGGQAWAYVAAQVGGGVTGAVLANVMFGLAPVTLSARDRVGAGAGVLVAEVVATAGLVALIVALARSGRAGLTAAAVGAYIGAAYWFTSSTSFANPAVTIGRTVSDTFAGIAPGSAAVFVVVQFVGALVGLVLARALYPDAGRAVVPPESVLDPQESR
jgi:glycerol uptake facilitator-like aquaporin